MINISNACLQALQNDAVQHVEIQAKLLSGETRTLTDADLVLNGFELENHAVCGEQLEVGSMTAAVLKLILDNEDGRFNNVFFAGATLTVKLLIPLPDGKDEKIPFGVYTVDEQPRTWSTIEIEAYDNMVKLDIPFSTADLPKNMTLHSLVDAGLQKAGLNSDISLSLFSRTTLKGGLDVTKIESKDTITWRQVLMWCCQCAGVCGFADGEGRIHFGFYKEYTPDVLQTELEANLESETGVLLLIDGAAAGDFPLTPSMRFIENMQLEEADCVLTGHQFKLDDTLYPENAVMDYGLCTENNLVFGALNDSSREFVASTVNKRLAGFIYRPYACDIVAMPHLQLLDGVDYYENGQHYHSIVTNYTFRLNGLMHIAAKAKSQVQKGWASLGALTPGQQAIIDSVSKKVDKTQADLTARETFLLQFNEAIAGSMGFYSTVKEQSDGSRISYMHNKPNLEESQTIYTFGVNGFAWTNDGWNNGSPIWHSGFDKNGNAILNAIYAYKLSADVIVSGLLQSQNGASWIDMRYGTFCFGSDAGTALALDGNKQLNVYGTIKNIKYPAYSVSIGASERGNFGALNATFDDANYGDIFQVHPTYWYNGDNQDDIVDRGMTITSPFVGTGDGNRQSVEFKSSEVMLWSEKNLGSVLLKGKNACVSVFRDNINISTGASHRHCWFNYFQPKYGYSPIAYDFGNGAGGHADILCSNLLCDNDVTAKGKIIAGGTTYWDNCKLSVHGESRISGDLTVENIAIIGGLSYSQSYALNVNGKARANSWDITSDRNAKENIEEITELNALYGIRNMRFYSYDYKEKSGFGNEKQDLKSQKFKVCADTYEDESTDEPIHMGIGIIADEAPSEIVSEDGKGIKLYAYISYIAKGIQELTDIVKSQAEEISELKAKLQGSIQ